ncbi:MAG: NAD-dependent epimerase/dehydratase family protein [Candidatus Aceula lacicola]|nr:NAD-dependent epimerase/dehydratase family protein [Candidatus Aceula lacicola]
MNDLKKSRVAVTGGAGCIGSFVVDEVIKRGVKEVVIVDNFTRGLKKNIEPAIASGCARLVDGDIRDFDLMKKTFKGIDYCFHLASLKIIQCVDEPRHALEVNVDGTFNVLEACADNNVKKAVFSSTASIYGQADIFPIKETHHPYNSHTLYGAFKVANELMFQSFYQMRGLKFNTLRYFNVFGPRMDAHGKYTEVLIRWYRLIKEGKQPLIYGDGKQTMDFIYVEDVARATVLALTADIYNGVFNCANGKETSLEELCCALLEVMGSDLKPKYVPIPEDRNKIEVIRRLADVSKAKEEINFKAQVTLKEGLKELVKWLETQKM